MSSLRMFLRRYESGADIEEQDLSNIIRFFDKNVDNGWSFKEFINSTTPLLQYSIKAKDLHKVQISEQTPVIINCISDNFN